jgi:hypothetical protein
MRLTHTLCKGQVIEYSDFDKYGRARYTLICTRCGLKSNSMDIQIHTDDEAEVREMPTFSGEGKANGL